MSHFLPANVMAFFEPRPPLQFQPALTKTSPPAYTGVSELMHRFDSVAPANPTMPTAMSLKNEQKLESEEEHAAFLAIQRQQYDAQNPQPSHPETTVSSNPSKTLFVGRLDYSFTSEMLKTEFEYFGVVEHATVVRHPDTGKSKGYGFVQFQNSDDMDRAYRETDGLQLGGRAIVVDVERGRTQTDWKPRRLGGGIGQTRVGPKWENNAQPGRLRVVERRDYDDRRDRDRRDNRDTRDNRDRGGDRYRRDDRRDDRRDRDRDDRRRDDRRDRDHRDYRDYRRDDRSYRD